MQRAESAQTRTVPAAVLHRTERRVASVLFCDIVGSSGLIATEELEDAQDRLSRAISAMHRQIERFGGMVCQTMGDGVLALFGVPNSLESHGVRACYAADAILREVRWGSLGDIHVRIGLSAGEILWDPEALGGRFRPPATGRPVHLAAKLQQAAPVDGILLCDGLAPLVADWIDMEPAAVVALGAEDAVPSQRQLGVHARPATAANRLPLLGRTKAISPLLDALVEAQLGFGSAHLLLGEAGIGKSRVLAELASRVRRLGIPVLEWVLPQVRAAGAADPVHEFVSALLGASLPPDLEAVRTMLADHGVRDLPGRALAELLHPYPGLAGDPTARLYLAADALVSLVRRAAGSGPLLLIVEDLHWADKDLQVIADRLALATTEFPLVAVASTRTAPELYWDGAARHDLLPLPGDIASQLLDHLMGAEVLLDPVKDGLLRRCQGNPFFLLESVRALVAGGMLAGQWGDLQPVGPVLPTIPTSVQAVLSARIDGLPAELRPILWAAAVIGPTFDVDLLGAVLGAARPDLDPHLSRLAADGFIDGTRLLPRLEYSFRHALLHEAVYANLTRKERIRLHARVAELLQATEFSDLRGREAALSRHAFRATDWAIAAQAGLRSGRDAFLQSRADEAFELLTLAVTASGHVPAAEPATGIDARLLLAKAAMTRGTAAADHLQEALRQCEILGDPRRQLTALGGLISHHWVHGKVDTAVSLGWQAFELSSRFSGRPLPEPRSWLVGALAENGQVHAALQVAERAIGGDTPVDPGRLRFMQLDALLMTEVHRARCLAELQDWSALTASVETILDLASVSDFPFERIYAWTYVAEIWAWQGRTGEALGLAEEALQVMRSLGAVLFEPRLLALAGWMRVRTGDGAGGLVYLAKASRLAARQALTGNTAWQLYAEASAYLLAGHADRGWSALRRAQTLARGRGAHLLLARLDRLAQAHDAAAYKPDGDRTTREARPILVNP
ncbi:AAA family ATPase [Oleisolibacter albus]|uniref:AAA family ATPase n=1 Tax=Oleisolibacter albus TaxID=2171757 RepID=UPI000DF24F1E